MGEHLNNREPKYEFEVPFHAEKAPSGSSQLATAVHSHLVLLLAQRSGMPPSQQGRGRLYPHVLASCLWRQADAATATAADVELVLLLYCCFLSLCWCCFRCSWWIIAACRVILRKSRIPVDGGARRAERMTRRALSVYYQTRSARCRACLQLLHHEVAVIVPGSDTNRFYFLIVRTYKDRLLININDKVFIILSSYKAVRGTYVAGVESLPTNEQPTAKKL